MPIPKRAGARPAVSIKKSVYAMASVDGDSAEITLYGDIYESRPVDWWTGEPIPGDFILLDDFLEDLKQIADCKDITVRINSYGGDAGVSNTIHNRLRELARNGAKLTCIVDGYAMSGGSLIMCACDPVRVNPSSLIMIHKSWVALWGGYNADDLRAAADQQDAWDKMQVEVYKRKTKLSDTVLMHMMSDTTTMTGREAVEKGFADELLEDAEPLNIAASADGRFLYVRGRKCHLAPGMFAPDSIPTVKPEGTPSVQTNTNTPDVTGNDEGGNSMTAEELRREHPEAVAKIEAEARASAAAPAAGAAQVNTDPQTGDGTAQAVSAERARIKAIDEIAGCLDPALVREAKYGDNACSASELALRAVQAAAKSGQAFLGQMERDANASGTSAVSAAPGEDPNAPKAKEAKTPEQKLEHARAQVAPLFGKEEKKNG